MSGLTDQVREDPLLLHLCDAKQIVAALLAAEDSDGVLEEVESVKPEIHRDDEGERYAVLTEATWEAILEDVARVRAAYREAVK